MTNPAQKRDLLNTSMKDLIPEHLRDVSTQDLIRGAQEDAAAKPALPEDAKLAAMRQDSYTFPFRYVDGNGKKYEGVFTHTVPDQGTRSQIGIVRAKLSGGMPYASLDEATRELNMIVADLTFTLTVDGSAEWAKDLRKLKDVEVLYRLWEVAAEHEAVFCGRNPDPGAGQE